MIIATRSLKLRRANRESEVEVRLHAPERDKQSWRCRFEIDWPEHPHAMDVHGVDAMQALILAMQTIGVTLYASDHHRHGHLVHDHSPSGGYGFPVHPDLRDLLTGDDIGAF